ncbi:MAG: hypothetical protein RRA92_10815 [Gemmatimonadota bacterium]|nr:hypothetical protein [Gemmatimonadota bacterium]
MVTKNPDLLKKLVWRLDGAADSRKIEFTSARGTRWEAELSLHSGTGPQSPNLLILFRNRENASARQRYTLVPPGYSKVPVEAAKQLGEQDLRELLSTSVEV